jgi:glycosyltransferase involved in cell wall biosynthesis
MKNPKVTVLMPVYNGEKYLDEAIDSILGQTFKDFEFLIVNDGSTDKTGEILKSYNDLRIKIINNEKNIGLTKSLNKGLKSARGEYIARQDADDISMPERLEKEVEFLEMHQDYAVVGTFAKIINENSKILYFLERPVEDSKIREVFKKDNCIIHGSSMIRKACLSEIGFYNELMLRSQDYELWLRLSKKYRFANIAKYLYMWRKHNENIEAKFIGEQKIFVILAMVKNNILENKKATVHFVNFIADKNMVFLPRILIMLFQFVKIITFGTIQPIMLLKFLIRICFSKKINKILRDFQTKRISFENTKLSLKDIINRRLI